MITLQAQALHTLGQRQVQVRLGQQPMHATVLEHVGQALLRVVRVERDIRAAGLENGEQRGQHVEGAFQRDAHQRVRANALLYQAVRQAVSPLVQGRVAPLLFAKDHCGCLWCAAHLLFELLLHKPARARADHAIALRHQRQLLGGGQERQLPQHGLRLGHQLRQQVQQVLAEAHDRRRIHLAEVIGVMQAQGFTDADGNRQRVVRLLTAVHRAEAHAQWGALLQHL